MADMTYGELGSDITANTADGLLNVARAARNFACELYQNSPASSIGYDVTGLGAFNNAVWTRLCGPINKLPPPAAPPFSGGQCPELYDITLTVVGGNEDGPFPTPDTRTFLAVQGPLRGWRFEGSGPDNDATVVYFDTAGGELSFGVQGLDGYSPQVSVDAIVPVDGSDACGNPPPTFPPDRAPLVEFQTNINVDFGGITIPVTVEFQPTIWVVPVVFSPQINVNVGPVTVSFGKDGVTFAPNFDVDTTISLPPGIDPRPAPPTPKPPVATDECDLSEVIEKLNELLDCDRCEKCYQPLSTPYAPLNSNIVNSLVGIPKRAVVTFVSGPDNLPLQSGNDAPTIYHAGWFSWRIGSQQLPRQRLDYEQNTFLAPEGVTGYSYTGTYGTVWQVTIISDQEIDCP